MRTVGQKIGQYVHAVVFGIEQYEMRLTTVRDCYCSAFLCHLQPSFESFLAYFRIDFSLPLYYSRCPYIGGGNGPTSRSANGPRPFAICRSDGESLKFESPDVQQMELP